jgi:hypothetical protein
MCSQIWRDATFEVESKKYAFPYKWKLSRWIFKGYVGRKKSMFFDLSLSFRNLYYMKNRFYQKKKENTYKNFLIFP